jgi:2-polyprenyl-6-methoxyphenol hydroxylase-like FAD-dependent oxidoreductase
MSENRKVRKISTIMKTPTLTQIQAVIIGAGPAGLAAALRLHQQTNIKCTVYELRPEPTTLGGAVGIQPNGLRLLHRLGVYDAAVARGYGGRNLTMHSLQGHVVGSMDFVGWAREQTGFGYLRIKRTDLQDVLLEAVRKAGIPVHFGKRVTTIDDGADRVEITFSDGETDSADLLFGCDGIHSYVRRTYIDPSQTSEYSGLSGIMSIVPAKTVSAEVMDQISGLEATLTEGGMMAMNPCTASKDELFWFFTKEVRLPDSGDSRDGWEVHGKEEVQGFKTMLLDVLKNARGDWGNALKTVVSNTSVVKFYPVYRLPLGKAWSKGRCVLVGDAAHAMSPHAGQGVSMALEDVFLLSRLLEDRTRLLSKVFEKYDAIRRPRVDEIFTMAVENGEMRKRSSSWGLWFKELKMSMALNLLWALGLDKRRQGHLVYDIDEVEL